MYNVTDETTVEMANHIGKTFTTVRNGVKKSVTLVEVKRRDVVLKDNITDKHSHTESLAKFSKYYRLT